MSLRRLAAVTLSAGAIVAAGVAAATDAPHDASSSPGIQCLTCHALHHADGGTITVVTGNANLCQSCHASHTDFGFPWTDSDQARPGSSGDSHRWDSNAVNATYGAALPTTQAMLLRVTNFGNKLACSVCHDQHLGASANRGTQHLSVTAATNLACIANCNAGAGNMQVATPNAAATPKGYLVEIVLGGAAGSATFHISHDNGTSWFGWTGTGWSASVPNTGRPTSTSAVALDDGTYMNVTFSGTFNAGQRFQSFFVSYPFPRILNDQSQMCEDCHASRVMTASAIESGGDGTKVFSHPTGTGVSLVRSYDRGATGMLAPDGTLQSASSYSVKTSYLHLDASNQVRCMTCHYPHNADSNSLTEDAR